MAFAKSTMRLATGFSSQLYGQTGLGGRSAYHPTSVAVFGAGGFLGRYTCNELGNMGVSTNIPNRGCELELRHLRPMFDLGQSKFVFYSPRDDESIRNALRGCDTVVKLIGKNYETRALVPKEGFPFVNYVTNFSFEETHVDVPRRIAEIAKEEGGEWERYIYYIFGNRS